MRIRLPFAGSFLFLIAITGYASFSTYKPGEIVSNEPLHAITFFILTTCFYWILDTSRRRSFNLTLLVCTGFLGVGFGFIQSLLSNGHALDLYVILANLIGSLSALGLCSWYHVRMLGRKRLAKQYKVVAQDEVELEAAIGCGTQESDLTDQAEDVQDHNDS
ncbi:Uncharacterized protein C11E3.10 [Erysiphe neolycopersici]|uniref:Uncharacterized protein C11E3.10 n=1 Tax=Erysiphe neolycopersici TaxID=212602 RepID=A0A420I3R8_9PEZI|nr:Uncharacterized protein C11E3.10 [Erysiphe neolycopersici]